jgi:hypothetical protein
MDVSSKFRTPGQLAHMTPIAISAAMTTGKPMIHPPKNVYSPIEIEKTVTILTNLDISFSK